MSTKNSEVEKKCFVIAPMGDHDSDDRKRSEQVFKHIISPAVLQRGYSPLSADQISEPGIITSQVIQLVVESELVIADLTDRNPNVFYELAVRHVIKKPLIQLIRQGEQIPFDVAATRTIQIDIHDLDSVEESKKEILKQIDSIENKGDFLIDTPITVAIDLKYLRESENPEERSLADVIDAITGLRKNLVNIEQKLSIPEELLPASYLDSLIRRRQKYPEYMNYIMEIIYQLNETINDKELTRDELFDSLLDIRRRLIMMRERFDF